MNTLFVLNDPPYGSERSYNALRLAASLAKRGEGEVRVFLMGDASACAKSGQAVPSGYYNLSSMLAVLTQRNVPVGACGSCMDARGISAAELLGGVHRSTIDELAEWTEWAAKVLVF